MGKFRECLGLRLSLGHSAQRNRVIATEWDQKTIGSVVSAGDRGNKTGDALEFWNCEHIVVRTFELEMVDQVRP